MGDCTFYTDIWIHCCLAAMYQMAKRLPLSIYITYIPPKQKFQFCHLRTGEGAFFRVHRQGVASADLDKHQIWVCPMFEPFLNWLYKQDVSDLDQLPSLVDL